MILLPVSPGALERKSVGFARDKLVPGRTISFPQTKSSIETVWGCSYFFARKRLIGIKNCEWLHIVGEESTINAGNSWSCVVLHGDLAC